MRSRLPKMLHPICGTPLVGHVVAALRAAEIDKLIVVASPAIADSGELRAAIGDDALIAIQNEQNGTAHALLQAREASGRNDNLMVVSGDSPLITGGTLKRLAATHRDGVSPVTLITAIVDSPHGLGRIRRSPDGSPVQIVEETDADEATRAIKEINSSVYCFDAGWLWQTLPEIEPSPSGEAYLTETVALAALSGRRVRTIAAADPAEVLGVNDRVQLAAAERAMRERIRRRWMLSGVSLEDPATIYIDAAVTIGMDTVIRSGSHLRGDTAIGEDCEIGPASVISNATIGDRSRITASFVESSRVGNDVSVGPYSHMRPGAQIDDRAHIGNFAEVKNSHLGSGTHVGHFSYVGDTVTGENANIGAGTVTCNFDGKAKHNTIIGNRAFVGSGSMLIAPLTIGDDAATGAGSVVTKDVPPDALAVGAPARITRRAKRMEPSDQPGGPGDQPA